MADIKTAIDFVLRQEDSTLAGHVTTLVGDTGGATRFGIASHEHPELTATGFFNEFKIDRDTALRVAEQVYAESYAAPLHIADIAVQSVATALLSFGINTGVAHAAKTFQAACVACGGRAEIDGKIGPVTLSVANAIDSRVLFPAFCESARSFYYRLAQHANDAQFLQGWLNRVKAWTVA